MSGTYFGDVPSKLNLAWSWIPFLITMFDDISTLFLASVFYRIRLILESIKHEIICYCHILVQWR